MSRSQTTTDGLCLTNVHPGEVIAEELLTPFGMTLDELANALGVCSEDLRPVIDQKIPVTADLDLRLARYFGLSDGFFLRLQIAFDLEEGRYALGPALNAITPRAA